MKLLKNNNGFNALFSSEFKYVFLGAFSCNLGIRMTSTIMGWWIYQLTKQPLYLGLIGVAEVLPALSFSLFAGHFVDVIEKTKLLRRVLISFIILYLSFTITGYLYENKLLFNYTLLFILYFLVFISGCIRAFSSPTLQSIVAIIVPKNILPRAVTIYKAQFFSSIVIGHILAGFLIFILGYFFTFIIILFLILIGTILLLQIKPKPLKNINYKQKITDSIAEGIKFVFKTKEILGVLSLDLFAVLFGGVVGILPIFAVEILQCNSVGFGWLQAATDLGAIITIFGSILFPIKKKQGLVMLWAISIFGIMIILFGLSKNYYLSFAALFISGLCDGLSVVIRSTILQLYTPLEMQGRVLSVNSIFINSSNEIGQLESGLAAKYLGKVSSVVFGGSMTIFIAVYTFFSNKKVRNLSYEPAQNSL